MQFALIDNERTRPSPGLTGSCPACGSAMIAKCGTQRVHHWAHRAERVCDSWWEPETPWHRAWKNKFPDHWQEVIGFDPSGEKHIADVRTDQGLTIEFQHSHLRPDERALRETFYGNMIWVVDGSRLIRDLPRFFDGLRSFRHTSLKGLYITPFPDEAFPRLWLNCSAPVVFDFEGAAGPAETTAHVSRLLWCLFPGRVSGQAAVLAISRDEFVRLTHTAGQPIPSRAILERLARDLAEQQRLAQLASMRAAMMARQRQTWRRGFRRRTARF